jgi:hypothetical protein
VLVSLVLLTRSPLAAQQQQAQQPPPGGARALGPRERRALEMRLRQEFGRVVKNRLGLNDAQMLRLQQSNQRFEPRRRQLLQDERRVRVGLRRELALGDSANQERASDLMDQWFRIQRQRVDLNEEEQKELAQFLTPIDRAKYLGLQDQFRQRIEQLLENQAGAQAPAAPGNNPLRRRPRLR